MKTLVFDVGGVLLDWSPYHLYRKLLPDDAAITAFLAEVDFPTWNVALDAGAGTWDAAVAEQSARHPRHAALIAAAHARWHEMVKSPIAGTVAILERHVQQGLDVYAITNFSSEKWGEARSRHGFLQQFRDVVVSGDEKCLKPDARIYHTLLQRNGLDAADCIFIDDSAKNVAGASAVGMSAIHFTSPEALAAELQRLGVPL